jgi:tetratricopeptide (TPR) repeat protein
MPQAADRGEQQRLEQARALVLRGDFAGAEAFLDAALAEFPGSFELRRVLAGVFRQTRRDARAEALLQELLRERPRDAGSAFTLAQLLMEQARTRSAGEVLRRCFESGQHDAELAIRAIELLDEADRKADAEAIAAAAIAASPDDPRLRAYAGMLLLQLGEFQRAREHLLFAMSHSPQACEWNVPHALASAQRYTDATHPDFACFRECLQRADLSDAARSTLLFAIGKAHDDIGDWRQAAIHFREANALATTLTRWSRKDWRRAVEARLAARPLTPQPGSAGDFVPVFIVGMPRSGTTLLAELLSRYPGVCNRGELPWLAKLALRPELGGDPSREGLRHAADFYAMQARRDDSPGARWFVDKQPLNFRYVDLMLALFPDARIIHCTRNSRDTALSLWMQSFSEDVQGYAYDFDDIAVVMRDCRRLMARWLHRYPDAIREVRYERLVADPEATVGELVGWLGVSGPAKAAGDGASISTASLWQARQPVYPHSLQRWRRYAEYIPELAKFADD